jgi:hypothetical protein
LSVLIQNGRAAEETGCRAAPFAKTGTRCFGLSGGGRQIDRLPDSPGVVKVTPRAGR